MNIFYIIGVVVVVIVVAGYLGVPPLMNEIARKRLGPRGVPGAPDTARMTPQEGKNIPMSGEQGR